VTISQQRRPYGIASALDVESWSYFLRGEQKAEPTIDGIAGNLKLLQIDPRNTIAVFQNGYATGSPQLKGSRYLMTYNLYPCVSLIACNDEKRLGFLAHIDSANSVLSTFDIAQKTIDPKKVFLFGGDVEDKDSCSIVGIMEGYLATTGNNIKVLGRDVLRGAKNRSTNIGIDTKTQEVFIPDIGPFLINFLQSCSGTGKFLP
jgi:hypothetical protein